MKAIPAKSQNEGGLHRRYVVTKEDGVPRDDSDKDAVYFVLRLDHRGDDRAHIRACHTAALAFCDSCDNARMARELRELVAYHAGMLVAREIAEGSGMPEMPF